MPYRILHFADVHLDMAFGGLEPSLGAQRRDQLRKAFERALALARRHQVDAVCIAGDLYEGDRSSPDRVAYLRRTLEELAPMRVFISPGNHDPYTPSSLYRALEPLPGHITIFKRRPAAAVRLTGDVTLWGLGHERPLDRDPILAGVACEGPGTHLLLFHGSDREHMPPHKDAIAPFTAADVEKTGAAHAMVGHFHGMLEGRHYAYPGSLEPHGFAKEGRHTVALVTVEDGRVATEFFDINNTHYVRDIFDVSVIGDAAQLESRIRERLDRLVPRPGFDFCRLRLSGSVAGTLEASIPELEAKLADDYPGLELIEDFSIFDFDAIESEGRTVRAEFVRTLRARLADAGPDERRLVERALQYGLLAFEGRSLAA